MAREETYAAATSYNDLVRRHNQVQPLVQERPQSLGAAVAAGLTAALLAALLWAALTVATGYNFVLAALGVGLMVGSAVRVAGNGSQPVFSLVGATLSAMGCALGNVLATCAYAANLESLPLMEVIGQLSPSLALDILITGAGPFDLIIFAVAAYEGYKISVSDG